MLQNKGISVFKITEHVMWNIGFNILTAGQFIKGLRGPNFIS